MRTNKKPILIIVIIAIIVILGIIGVGIYLYIATDFLKSNQDLFAKYLNQNLNEMSELINFSEFEEISATLEQSKYENETSATMTYGSNEIGINIFTQKDSIENKAYTDIDMVSNNESILNAELYNQEDMLSIRFTDIVMQFISIENNNLEQLAENLGIDEQLLKGLFNNETESSIKFTDEEIQTLKNKYINILSSSIPKGNYQKQKNTMITINSNTITANAYILELTGEQQKQIKTSILENIKQEEIILQKIKTLDEKYGEILNISIQEKYVEQIENLIKDLQNEEESSNIKITIYEQSGKTVRIKIEQGLNETTIDTVSSNEILGIDIKSTRFEGETEEAILISIQKSRSDRYNLAIDINYENEESANNISFNLSAINNQNNIEISSNIMIQDVEINLESNIDIVNEINYNVELDNSNNIILNNLNAETCNSVLELLKNNITEKYQEQLMSIFIYNITDNVIEEVEGEEGNGGNEDNEGN